jgi:hypothetical protein
VIKGGLQSKPEWRRRKSSPFFGESSPFLRRSFPVCRRGCPVCGRRGRRCGARGSRFRRRGSRGRKSGSRFCGRFPVCGRSGTRCRRGGRVWRGSVSRCGETVRLGCAVGRELPPKGRGARGVTRDGLAKARARCQGRQQNALSACFAAPHRDFLLPKLQLRTSHHARLVVQNRGVRLS